MFSLADEPKSMFYQTILREAADGIRDPLKLHPYHILYRYSRFLGLKESTLRMTIKDEDIVRDLLDLAGYFLQRNVDTGLLKMGLPYILPYTDGAGSTEYLTAHLDGLLSSTETMSSRAFIQLILPEDDPVYRVFAKGSTISDVLSWQKELKAASSSEKPSSEAQPAGKKSTEDPSAEKTSSQAPSAEKKTSSEVPAADESSGETSSPEKPATEAAASKKPSSEETGKTAAEAVFPEKDTSRDFRKLAKAYRELRIKLQEVVKGQSEAIQEFVQGLFQADVLHEENSRKLPAAVFLFVGPPGVGKTLMAETAAKELGLPSMTFNMSEYADPNNEHDLIGTPAVFSNAKEGRLPKFVRENPRSILIFDEIEKASRLVIQHFLQILDLGVMDNIIRQETVSFADTIIIFTSNACASIYENDFGNISATPKNVILNALKNEEDPLTHTKKFPAAICSRIAGGNMIMFNHLGLHILNGMVSDKFQAAAREITKEYGYKVSIDKRLPLLFILNHGAMTDARIASRQSTKFLKNELFEIARQLESHDTLMDGIRELDFELGLPDASAADKGTAQILELFENKETAEIAVLCDSRYESVFAFPDAFRMHFTRTAEELTDCLKKNEINLVLIDPLYGPGEHAALGISLDDSYAIGVRTFQHLMRRGENTPVFIVELSEALNQTDRNSFLRMGAAGIISALGHSSDELLGELRQIVEKLYMEKKGGDFTRRGYVVGFNTAQVPQGDRLRIIFHDLQRTQALDPTDAGAFLRDEDRPKVKFDDVIGAENAKEELRAFVKYLAHPAKYIAQGKKPPKGILLYGPPGTGKTMLARAMAGESGAAFIQTSASAFMNKYVGQTEQNIRDLFRKAKRYAPAVIFIDEIDAIGKERNGQDSSGVTESALNTLLTEMDGFQTDPRHQVFVLAATNYPVEADGSGKRALDPALVRRFDNRIYVDLPNENEREQYLTLAVENKCGYVSAADIHNLAARTTGKSIAVLQNIVALAVRNAEKKNRSADAHDLQNALEEYTFGEKKTFSRDYYESVAIHESGHAYIAWKSGERPSYITIESRGDFGGYMQHENAEEKPNYTRDELVWKIRCALAGRAAEEVFFGKESAVNTGASGDLQTATNLAMQMFCAYGMMEDTLVTIPYEKVLTTSFAGKYIEAADSLLRQEMEETLRLIREGRETVRRLADRVLEQNNLTEEEIAEVLSGEES